MNFGKMTFEMSPAAPRVPHEVLHCCDRFKCEIVSINGDECTVRFLDDEGNTEDGVFLRELRPFIPGPTPEELAARAAAEAKAQADEEAKAKADAEARRRKEEEEKERAKKIAEEEAARDTTEAQREKPPSLSESVHSLATSMQALADDFARITEQMKATLEQKKNLETSVQLLRSDLKTIKGRETAARVDLEDAEQDLKVAEMGIHYALIDMGRDVKSQADRVLVHMPGQTNTLLEINYQGSPDAKCMSRTRRELDSRYYSVIDGFLGTEMATEVRATAVALNSVGKLTDGKLGGGRTGANLNYQMKHVRGDRVGWFSGLEPNCGGIAQIILRMDHIVYQLARSMPALRRRCIERQQAMVTCYPGGGARYIKHCDNPNRNGRILTAIYYLNPSWASGDGGELRIHGPANDSAAQVGSGVEDVAPLFDRLVLFFSDKRVPHEVLPCNKSRYAVTVWYLDGVERQAALRETNESDAKAERVRIRDEIKTFQTEVPECSLDGAAGATR